MLRRALRKPEVLQALGLKNTQFHRKIQEGLIPPGTRIDPNGRAVVWWEDEIIAIQQAAIKRASKEAV